MHRSVFNSPANHPSTPMAKHERKLSKIVGMDHYMQNARFVVPPTPTKTTRNKHRRNI